MLLGYLLMNLINMICADMAPSKVSKYFRRCNWSLRGSTALAMVAHDAPEDDGIIAILLFSTGHLGEKFLRPDLGDRRLPCLDRLRPPMFGGWRIVKTMGMKITKLAPVGGFAAEAAAQPVPFSERTFAGIPITPPIPLRAPSSASVRYIVFPAFAGASREDCMGLDFTSRGSLGGGEVATRFAGFFQCKAQKKPAFAEQKRVFFQINPVTQI
jgi:hypothetical protein